MTDVRAIGARTNNAEAIRDAAQLGYLAGAVLDTTYGLGRFWKLWTPDHLVAVDLNPTRSRDWPLGVDVRDLPFDDATFDAVVFDPPYKLNGTSTGRGASASDEDYGVEQYMGRVERHQMIRDGITEAHRVARPGGHVLVKCMDQVNGGRVRWQTREFADHAEALGARLVDALHVQGYRAQPAGRSQQHARRDYSTLLVLRKTAEAGA